MQILKYYLGAIDRDITEMYNMTMSIEAEIPVMIENEL